MLFILKEENYLNLREVIVQVGTCQVALPLNYFATIYKNHQKKFIFFSPFRCITDLAILRKIWLNEIRHPHITHAKRSCFHIPPSSRLAVWLIVYTLQIFLFDDLSARLARVQM